MMRDPMPPDRQTHRKLTEAFASFETSLREVLTHEARRSVDGAIERLSLRSGPYRVSDVQVDVLIRTLSVESVHAESEPPPRRKRVRAPAPKRTAARGRPPGPLRTALLAAFSVADGDLDTQVVRELLDERGVQCSADNLHQQLRRLVAAGEIERAGRGLYRRHPDSGAVGSLADPPPAPAQG
jgi:hypothetical protein